MKDRRADSLFFQENGPVLKASGCAVRLLVEDSVRYTNTDFESSSRSTHLSQFSGCKTSREVSRNTGRVYLQVGPLEHG